MSGDRLDGGILDNLPIEALASPTTPGSEFGDIVAISFEEPPFTEAPQSAAHLAMSLLDTAMTNKTRASRNIIGTDNVFELQTTVGSVRVDSFDIHGFIRFINDQNAYGVIKARASQWFKEFVVRKEQGKIVAVTPTLPDVDRQLNSIQSNLRTLAQRFIQHPTLKMVESVFEVIAFCLETPDAPRRKPDLIRYVDTFRTGDQPLFMYAARISPSVGTPTASATGYKIFNSKKQKVEFSSFSVPDDASDTIWNLMFFTPPLPPTNEKEETYTIIQEYELPDSMLNLHLHGTDYLAATLVQAVAADIAEIRLCVPKSFDPLVMLPGSPANMQTLPFMADTTTRPDQEPVPGAIITNTVVELCPDTFNAYVWRAENCKRDDIVRVVVRKKGVQVPRSR